jgi:uncharacterized protein YggT (Ycf19 family)
MGNNQARQPDRHKMSNLVNLLTTLPRKGVDFSVLIAIVHLTLARKAWLQTCH